MATQTTIPSDKVQPGQPEPAVDRSEWTLKDQLHFDLGMWDGRPGSPVKYRELPERTWPPNEEWRSLRGILSGHPEHDTTKARAAERAWELEQDERKFGPFPER